MQNPGLPIAAGTVAVLMGIAAGTGPKTTAEIPAALKGAAAGSTIEVLAPKALPNRWMNDASGQSIFLTLRSKNQGGQVDVYHTLTDRFGRRAPLQISPASISLNADQITEVQLALTGKADLSARYTGDLLLVPHGANLATTTAASVSLTVAPSELGPASDHVLLAGVVLALASFLLGAIVAMARFGPLVQMDPISWTSGSWATNTTIASSVLTALAVLVVPQDLRMRLVQDDYRYLMIVFGLPALIAPVIFNLVRRDRDVQANKGLSLGFVLAAAATLLAAQTQTVLLLTMLDDLFRSVVFSETLSKGLQATIGLVALMLVVYGNYIVYVSIRDAANNAAAPMKPALL